MTAWVSRIASGALAAALSLAVQAAWADVVVSNVRAQQMTDGTKRVEVLYDLAGAPSGGATVSVAFSATGGAPYGIVPGAGSLSGAVGVGVTNGASKRLVWDCKLTLPAGTYGTTYRAAVTAVAPGSGQEITVGLTGGVQFVMVNIPAGTFWMGSSEAERGRSSNESPQHRVTLTKSFYMGRTEVTQEQWQEVMGTTEPRTCGLSGIGPDYPVYCVSWNDICGGDTGSTCTPTSFIGRLNQLVPSMTFRLPTEAEWEYAARARTTTEFSFPASATWDTACGTFSEAGDYMWWCGNNTPSGAKPVGQKLPNPWGLYDMHGNIWEWVADWYGSYSGQETDPQGPATGSLRVVRGGTWNRNASYCRSAYRYGDSPGTRYGDFGFRLARSQ